MTGLDRRYVEAHPGLASGDGGHRPGERELARWDGSLLTLDPEAVLDPPAGAVMVSVHLGTGTPLTWEAPVYQPMARIPTAVELLHLVAGAREGWSRTNRRLLIVRCRPMAENEARAAWGDR